jgi:hypothetical protein
MQVTHLEFMQSIQPEGFRVGVKHAGGLGVELGEKEVGVEGCFYLGRGYKLELEIGIMES